MHHLVFSVDRRMLAALHVAALSILERYREGCELTFHVFSAELNEADISLLNRTLALAGRRYHLQLETVNPLQLAAFPKLRGSLANYFRLLAPALLGVERLLYCDVDTLCQVDLSPLVALDLGDSPIALAPEAPIHASVDPAVARLLGARACGHYYNTGVMVVAVDQWRGEKLTERCFAHIGEHQPVFHEQSVLNYLLHGRIHPLSSRYNCRTNARENWPDLLPPAAGEGRLLHFIDFPKPWSPCGRWIHPLGGLWWRCYRRTAHYQENQTRQVGSRLRTFAAHQAGYRRTLKDKLLFSALAAGLIQRVKGMP